MLYFRSEKVSKALTELEEKGVTVVDNILTPTECNQQIAILKKWLEKFEPEFPYTSISLIHGYKIGHCETAWFCRMKAKHIFAELFGTEKLLTSFDGLAIAKPAEFGDTRFTFNHEAKNDKGLHLDQGPNRSGLHAYQGAIYLEEATASDYCFKVIEKSHKFFDGFFENFEPNPRAHYRLMTEREVDWYLSHEGCSIERVAVPQGGMVLWDSRTVHAGAPPLEGRDNPR